MNLALASVASLALWLGACADTPPASTPAPQPAPEPTAGQVEVPTEPELPTGELHGVPPPQPMPLPDFAHVENRDGTARAPEHLQKVATALWFYPQAGTSG